MYVFIAPRISNIFGYIEAGSAMLYILQAVLFIIIYHYTADKIDTPHSLIIPVLFVILGSIIIAMSLGLILIWIYAGLLWFILLITLFTKWAWSYK